VGDAGRLRPRRLAEEAQVSPHGKRARPLKKSMIFEKFKFPKISIPTFESEMR
jgi:hypothetical protein